MSSYIGRHAELYDLFYQDKPYEAEAKFVHSSLTRFSDRPPRRVLELACGTGSHALVLGALGYDVTATDYSADMLRRAEEKARAAASQVRFRQADMRRLPDPETPYDAVICLFDSLGYVVDNRAIADVFAGVRRQLRPGGLFVFEFWHAAAMLRHYDPLRIRRWTTADGEVMRISETEIDCVHQTARVRYTVYELRPNGTYTTFTETQENRFFLLAEMQALLAGACLEPVRFYAGFSEDEQVQPDTWHIVAVVRAPR